MGRSLFLLLASILLASSVSVQDSLYVYGKVRDRGTMDSISFPTIQFQVPDQKEPPTHVVTQANGKYEVYLLVRKAYRITFGAEGHITRSVEVDLRNIPASSLSGGLAMYIAMTLPREMPGFNTTLFKLPAGKARYDPAKDSVVWDEEYTNGISQRIDSIFQEYDRRQAVH